MVINMIKAFSPGLKSLLLELNKFITESTPKACLAVAANTTSGAPFLDDLGTSAGGSKPWSKRLLWVSLDHIARFQDENAGNSRVVSSRFSIRKPCCRSGKYIRMGVHVSS
jgi:hypothetical protein